MAEMRGVRAVTVKHTSQSHPSWRPLGPVSTKPHGLYLEEPYGCLKDLLLEFLLLNIKPLGVLDQASRGVFSLNHTEDPQCDGITNENNPQSNSHMAQIPQKGINLNEYDSLCVYWAEKGSVS